MPPPPQDSAGRRLRRAELSAEAGVGQEEPAAWESYGFVTADGAGL